MKILMTADTVGGVWTYALDLARGLGLYGASVHLATMGAPLSADQWYAAGQVHHLTIHESDYRLEWMDDPWDDVRAAGDWLIDLDRELSPDIVHLNGYAHGTLPWSAPVLVCAHSCVLSWWQAVKNEPAPLSWCAYRNAVTDGIRAADLVVAPTHAMLDTVRANYLESGCGVRTLVIPNGRDDVLYAGGRKKPFVLSAGRLWDEAKNVAALVDIAPDLPWPVYVAGDPGKPDISDAETNASPVRAADWEPTASTVHPHWLGRLPAPDLAAWYAQASIYALPARYEPFGLSILEAALSGCALVIGDIPSLREVWGDAAVFARPDDSAHLRAQIMALIENEPLRLEMARRACERAKQYTATSMASAYYAAYKQLRAGRAGGARQLQTEEIACTS
jgi:glycosyltransferase involved in cell wall biosynthesis